MACTITARTSEIHR